MASEWIKETLGSWSRSVGDDFCLAVWEGVHLGELCWYWDVRCGDTLAPRRVETEAQAKAAAERCMSDKIRDMLRDLPDPCP